MGVRLRISLMLASVVVLIVALALLAAEPSPAAERTREAVARGAAPERLLVTAREWSLALSRGRLGPGQAIVELYNYGEDPHDLQLRRRGSPRAFSLDEVPPGESDSISMKLRRASRYRLWCSLSGHRALGMDAKLKVKRKRR